MCTAPRLGAGEGHEDHGVRGDGLGDPFAASEAGGDELVGVALVGGRTGGTAGSPAMPARFEQDPIG